MDLSEIFERFFHAMEVSHRSAGGRQKKMYNVELVKMIRNNNMVINKKELMRDSDTYFMLDYFDLMFHKSFIGEEKEYKKFWNIEREISDETLEYKSAYKTLSLYIDCKNDKNEIWKREPHSFSATPFLGIIQINILYHIYKKELEVRPTLEHLETEIIKEVVVSSQNKPGLHFQMYRSSTSSDFCLIVRSNRIEDIFQISTLINNMIISYNETEFNFRTYTNVGIECVQNIDKKFQTFSEDIIELNNQCKFSIRFTTSNEFASKEYKSAEDGKVHYLIEHMSGLFGRYDFMVHLTMEEFARIYPVLCKSKVLGNAEEKGAGEAHSLVELLVQGIENGEVQIINERVLVSLGTAGAGNSNVAISQKKELLEAKEKKFSNVVRSVNRELGNSVKEFQKLEGEFIEERRVFIDISRELKEVINTYVPQGMDHDSHVNWLILISDLRVVFECINDWKDFYKNLKDETQKKEEREHFLDDLRLATEAINQYYKFLQNVNAQTWQSPLYEIQTQLDAEKMMIAYREFLYEYFCKYRESFKNRPMFYPIIYPDMATDIACVYVPFRSLGDSDKKLLICKVPSFEYYGRAFDMVPWTLHEASHSIRTMERKERNMYLANAVLYSVCEQALYEVLNKYTNDFGYHSLGVLERRIVKKIEKKIYLKFVNFCKDSISNLDIYMLQTKIMNFLTYFFDDRSYIIEKSESEERRKAIQAELLKYYAELNMLEENNIEKIESCMNNFDKMEEVLEIIYDSFFNKIWGQKPECKQWVIVTFEADLFEKELYRQVEAIKGKFIAEESQIRAFCFRVREINRLYNTWNKRGEIKAENEKKEEIWEECIGAVRKEIESGFRNNEGFTEIYRIFNMIFGSGPIISDEDLKRVSEFFNVLSSEVVYGLVEREISIYRETCADLYMVATLGLNAFGYCRQIFQTASEVSVKENMGWEEGTNFHRFMMVTAVLLSGKHNEIELGEKVRVSATELCKQGKSYCLSTLECLREKLSCDCAEDKKKKRLVEEFIDVLKREIEGVFAEFKKGDIAEILKRSILVFYAQNLGEIPEDDDPEVKEKAENVINKFCVIEENLKGYRHVLYRVQYFIYALSTIMDNEEITVARKEFVHMKKLYHMYKKKREEKSGDTVSVIALFYNNPQTAADKSVAGMLDDTIRFIEEYYYRNRFKIMSSKEIREEVKKVENEQCT